MAYILLHFCADAEDERSNAMIRAMVDGAGAAADGVAAYVAEETKAARTNWKTTIFGLLIILYAVIPALMAMLDGKPETVPDWNSVHPNVMFGMGLIFARDGK
jgi:hypothetical protein